MTSNRRSFLKQSAVATAAPFILPSSIWSAETKPNDKVAMGFIGVGKQSRGLMGGFLGHDTQVLAVCDVDTTRREDARQKVDKYYEDHPDKGSKGCKGYNDFREITGRTDIDAVCVATPDHWHTAIVMAALKGGKDVYCEKPLTHNVHESIELISAVDANKRVLQTGSMQRSSSEFRIACELVRNGVIGKIERVECQFGDPGRPCDLPEEAMEPGLDWNMWLGPAQVRPYNSVLSPRGMHDHFPNWRSFREFGGGMVTDWGAHHLDIAQWGLGMDDSGPVEVRPPEKEGDKRGATLVYENGVTVKHSNGFGVHFFGTGGEVKVNRGKFVLIVGGEVKAKFEKREDGGSLGAELQKAEKGYLAEAKVKLYNSKNHIWDFMDCIKSRQKPITSEQVGGRSAICCHLMNQAYYNHKVIKWDPKKFAFRDGTGDPAWLTRDYRAPFKV